MTINISLQWDVENLRPSATDARKTAKRLVRLIKEGYERLYPGTRVCIEFKAYGDSNELPGELRAAFVDAGADMIHVPGPVSRMVPRGAFRSDDGDRRQIIYDMFAFAKRHGPPAVLVLVSGDADFILTLEALQVYGFTTISVYNFIRMGVSLRGVADYAYYWNDLNQQNGVLKGPPNQKALKLLDPKERIAPGPNQVLILWDFKTMSPPNHVTHADACADLSQRVTQILAAGGITMGMSSLKIFGDTTELPDEDSRSGLVAEYVTTTDSDPIKKATHINNEMTSKMMRFFYEHNPPATIVVVSTRSELARTLLSLTNATYTTVVCKRNGYDTKPLKDASTLEFQFPWDCERVMVNPTGEDLCV